jgi:hypothetical protein
LSEERVPRFVHGQITELLEAVKGIKLTNRLVSKEFLAQLFVLSRKEMRILGNPGQFIRFVENFESKNQKNQRNVNFSEMGLGDKALELVASLITAKQLVSLDVGKNSFTE